MSFLLTCPNCGVREVTDFGYGGEVAAAARRRARAWRELNTYNYFRRNVAGVQREWWFHRSGCRAWFLAERDTRTNEVHWTALPDDARRRATPRRRSRPARRREATLHDPAPAAAGRAHRRARARHVHLRRQARRRATRATRSPRRSTRPGGACSRARSSTTARAASCAAAASARTRSSPSTGARASAPAASRSRDGHGRRRTRTRGRRSSFDVMRATDLVGGPFTPPGFYYKTFIRPRRLWPVYEKVLRHAAGLGGCASSQDEREWRTEYRRRHCDVLVIGGGIAGLAAALARRRARRRRRARATRTPSPAARCSPRAATSAPARSPRRPATRASRSSPARPRSASSTASSRSGRATRCTRSAPRGTSSATGAIEQPLVFADNDLPGVMLAGGARRLAALYGVRPGSAAVVATTGDRGLDAALALREAGVEIARRRRPAARAPAATLAARAAGSRRRAARRARPSCARTGARRVDRRACSRGSTRRGAADRHRRASSTATCSCVSGGAVARDVAAAPGRREGPLRRGDRAASWPTRSPTSVLAAGAVAGHEDADAAELSGAIAGAEAAAGARPRRDGARDRALDDERERLDALPAPSPVAAPPAYARDGKTRRQGVRRPRRGRHGQGHQATPIAEGYDSIELSKRYTTVTMGPSQGRFSQLAVDPRARRARPACRPRATSA